MTATTGLSTTAGRLAVAVAALALLSAAAHADALAAVNGPIVFERGGAILSTPAAGGPTTVLATAGYDPEPAWSPDSRRIASPGR